MIKLTSTAGLEPMPICLVGKAPIEVAPGEWYAVIPETWRDIQFLADYYKRSKGQDIRPAKTTGRSITCPILIRRAVC
jgi:hypothetical protein